MASLTRPIRPLRSARLRARQAAPVTDENTPPAGFRIVSPAPQNNGGTNTTTAATTTGNAQIETALHPRNDNVGAAASEPNGPTVEQQTQPGATQVQGSEGEAHTETSIAPVTYPTFSRTPQSSPKISDLNTGFSNLMSPATMDRLIDDALNRNKAQSSDSPTIPRLELPNCIFSPRSWLLGYTTSPSPQNSKVPAFAMGSVDDAEERLKPKKRRACTGDGECILFKKAKVALKTVEKENTCEPSAQVANDASLALVDEAKGDVVEEAEEGAAEANAVSEGAPIPEIAGEYKEHEGEGAEADDGNEASANETNDAA